MGSVSGGLPAWFLGLVLRSEHCIVLFPREGSSVDIAIDPNP